MWKIVYKDDCAIEVLAGSSKKWRRFRESMGQSVTCMGALHPSPKFIFLHQFNVTEQWKDLHLILTLESKCVDLNSKHS